MGNPLECRFLEAALDDATEEGQAERVLAEAGLLGCDGQCALEDGCCLYKSLPDTDVKKRLGEELVEWLLGEQVVDG